MKPSLPALLSAALVLLSIAPGCEADSNAIVEEAASESASATLHGRYRFVLDEARRTELHAELATRLSGADLEQAKRAVDEEVAASVVEFTRDGRFRSLVADQVLVDAAVKVSAVGDDHYRVSGLDRDILVHLEDGDLLVMADPQKGELTFERLR